MANPYEYMKKTIAERALFEADDALLLMVSGGSDSTALARLVARLRDDGEIRVVTMLHMNHKLRGADADADAAFVAALAEELSIPLFMCEMDIAAEAARSGENVEAVARRERYAAAQEAMLSMCQHECIPLAKGHIVTAHTSDDRIENFYMRSIVGTGPGGFRSMLYKNGPVVRPLLDCSRQALRDYLAQDAGLGDADASANRLWREDATNAHTDRFRAYVRHEVVPKAREWNPSLGDTLTRTMNLIAEEDDMLDGMAASIISRDVEPLGGGDALDPADPYDGYLLKPHLGEVQKPLQRRVVHRLLKTMLGADERIDASAVDAVLSAFADGSPVSGYVTNIQGNLAVSANKKGVRIEPMAAFRARRKKA